MQENSVKCTVCKKCIHKRYTGDLSPVVDSFRCKRCCGAIQKADLTEHLVVDGETYGCVNSFCYLNDTLYEMVERILLL